MRLFLIAAVCLVAGNAVRVQAAPATWTKVTINTNGTPRGYWEYLPSAYYDNPTAKLPVVIFFHGLGEGGDGSLAALDAVDNNGPPKIAGANVQSNVFQTNNAILLCPQYPANTWWSAAGVRGYLTWALGHYASRIDTRRIYLTGLSAGSSGINDFLDNDANADQATAILITATRGDVTVGKGDKLGEVMPFWGLTAVGDASNGLTNSVDRMADYIKGSNTNMNTPNISVTKTGRYDPTNGWVWQDGVINPDGKNPNVTLYPGSNHDSWTTTYNNATVWAWLFAQVKPTLTMTSPSDGYLLPAGQTLLLSATAVDADGAAIPASNIRWKSSIEGNFGTGTSLSVSNLSPGVHRISCTAIDTKYRGVRKEVNVTVPYVGAYTIFTDFGPVANITNLSNWNNITNVSTGKVDNAVDSTGFPVGVKIEITTRFDSSNVIGVVSSALYPETAQTGAMFVSQTYQHAEVTVSGLNPAQPYSFTFFGSRAANDSYRWSNYTIGGQTVTLNAANNTDQTISLTGKYPDAAGKIVVRIDRPGNANTSAYYAYLNVMTITSDGSAAPEVLSAIDCGGAGFTAADGVQYQPDTGFTGGASGSFANAVGETLDDGLYQTHRQGNFTYALNVPNGDFMFTLKFAQDDTAPGVRAFTASAETFPILTSFDLAEVAPSFSAHDRSFYVTVKDGKLNLAIDNGAANGRLSAILLKKPTGVQQAYFAWRTAAFTANQVNDPSVAGLSADPERDGRTNLEEFAFGGNAMSAADGQAVPRLGDSGLTFEFRRRDPATVGYRVLVSDDGMESWTEYAHIYAGESVWSGDHAASVSEGSAAGGFRAVTVDLGPLSADPAAFVRVQVIEP